MPAGLKVMGPAVIESLESTILVPPGWHARMDEDGFVLLTPLVLMSVSSRFVNVAGAKLPARKLAVHGHGHHH